jgi:hypothetical protein
MKLKSLFFLTLGTVGWFAVKTQAQSFTSGIISVDFFNTVAGQSAQLSSSAAPFGPGAAAIGSAGDDWNGIDLSLPLSTSVSLLNNNGVATGVSFNGSDNDGYNSFAFSGTYAALFDTDISFAFNSTAVQQITGLIPNAKYNFYLYSVHDAGISVNGTIFSSSQPTSPENSLVPGTGYSEGIVTADAAGDLDISQNNPSSLYSAFQLTPVTPTPEPSVFALAGLGGLLAGGRRCFKKTKN